MAVTIGFGGPDVDPYIENGFSIDVARIDSGNCNVAPCMALNSNETSTLTQVGNGPFTLNSFWFQLLGAKTELTVTPYQGATALTPIIFDTVALGGTYIHNSAYTFSTAITNVTSIVFDNTNTENGAGNIRIDDINVSAYVQSGGLGETPLPGTLPLFASGLGMLGLLGWRRKRKASAALIA